MEGPPAKIWEGKNVQNSGPFNLTTFDFDVEYFRNGSTYRKSDVLISYNPSHAGRKKVGAFWSTNNKVIAQITGPKCAFSVS